MTAELGRCNLHSHKQAVLTQSLLTLKRVQSVVIQISSEHLPGIE